MNLEKYSILSSSNADSFKNIVADTLELARAGGATQAEAGLSVSQGLSVATRMGSVETIEHQQDNGLGISVYFDGHKGSCNIARYTSEDPCTGLADAELMATDFRDLDLYHPWDIQPQEVIDLALECENAALDYDARIVNSEGGSVDLNVGLSVYGNSHGFLQAEHKTRHGISCAVVAESNGNMQRDYWYDVSRHPDRLASARSIGEKAAERTLRRLDAHKLKTQQAPVLFAAELGRGIISSFTSAIGGAAQYRKASFLLDAIGEQVFPDFMQMREQPFLPQALASANFDGEGVATHDASLVVDGVIQNYLLDTYSARKLGLCSTGHASGIHNLSVDSTGKSFAECLTAMHRGFLVTELMGHGVNTVTGDYSRGAAGFWVENGKLDHAVEEVTIAANLRDMFKGIVEIGNDVDYRGGIHCGSILIDNMTIAGAD